MKKISLTLLLVLLFLTADTDFLYPGKCAELSEILNPFKMIVEKNQLYISEGASIFIYSLPDCRLVKKFGQQGEGPGEFKVSPNANLGSILFDVFPDFLVVYSRGRISFFTKQGEYIKEMKFTTSAGYFKPLGKSGNNGYVGLSTRTEDNGYYTTVNIYTPKLEKVKELYCEKAWFSPGKPIDIFNSLRGVSFDVSENIICLEKEKTTVLLFNHEGEQVGSFTPPYQPLKLTSKHKKEFMDVLENSSQFKAFYERFKPLLKFPEYFPAICSTLLADQKIYVISWRRDQGKSETFVYDIAKKTIDKIQLPLREIDAIVTYPFTIAGGKLYQLVENDETGNWELLTENL